MSTRTPTHIHCFFHIKCCTAALLIYLLWLHFVSGFQRIGTSENHFLTHLDLKMRKTSHSPLTAGTVGQRAPLQWYCWKEAVQSRKNEHQHTVWSPLRIDYSGVYFSLISCSRRAIFSDIPSSPRHSKLLGQQLVEKYGDGQRVYGQNIPRLADFITFGPKAMIGWAYCSPTMSPTFFCVRAFD